MRLNKSRNDFFPSARFHSYNYHVISNETDPDTISKLITIANDTDESITIMIPTLRDFSSRANELKISLFANYR